MSTKMSDADWKNALFVFREYTRRGAKAKDDQLFLEALHHFSLHNITWAGRCPSVSASGTACGNASTG